MLLRENIFLSDPVRGEYKDWRLTHSLDVWHVSKNLGRKLREVSPAALFVCEISFF